MTSAVTFALPRLLSLFFALALRFELELLLGGALGFDGFVVGLDLLRLREVEVAGTLDDLDRQLRGPLLLVLLDLAEAELVRGRLGWGRLDFERPDVGAVAAGRVGDLEEVDGAGDPRWSVVRPLPIPWSTAGLVRGSAIVRVGPPLASTPRPAAR